MPRFPFLNEEDYFTALEEGDPRVMVQEAEGHSLLDQLGQSVEEFGLEVGIIPEEYERPDVGEYFEQLKNHEI